MRFRRISLFFGLFSMVIFNSNAVNLTGLLNSHDPASIIKDGDTYWHFTTGDGIWSSISTNLSHWEGSPGPVFSIGTWPSWINDYVPDFGGHFWAPDIIFMNGMYYLYYSCSTWGSSRSAIGVVMTESLNSPDWHDLGVVVYSGGTSTEINAIDPGLFRDTDGRIYLTYGSWFGGIGIVEIDSVYGTPLSDATHIYGGSHQSIEASKLIKKDNYYYLIVNRGNCCQGVNSTYYITAGRSTNITGPYEDFRTILSTDGKYIGPGHFGLLQEKCGDFVSVHYYDGDDNGNAKLDILKMSWVDGWPELTRNFSFDPCWSGIESGNLDLSDYKIEIFPNPARGSFTIELFDRDSNKPVNIAIFNLQGKKILMKNYFSTDILNINGELEEGIYFIQVENGRNIFVRKFIIQ